jgi:Heterokaryon incompatibility protein (HET)
MAAIFDDSTFDKLLFDYTSGADYAAFSAFRDYFVSFVIGGTIAYPFQFVLPLPRQYSFCFHYSILINAVDHGIRWPPCRSLRRKLWSVVTRGDEFSRPDITRSSFSLSEILNVALYTLISFCLLLNNKPFTGIFWVVLIRTIFVFCVKMFKNPSLCEWYEAVRFLGYITYYSKTASIKAKHRNQKFGIEDVREMVKGICKLKPYYYCRLDPAHREIRLLKVSMPNSNSSPRIALASFPICSAPPYEAISYTWADQNNSHYIELNDDRWLLVTKNVWTIIREVATPFMERHVWIDALCINQSDREEKATQVEMMGDIYGNAVRVIVWLGNEDVTSSEATRMFSLLHKIRYDMHSDTYSSGFDYRQKEFRAFQDSIKPLGKFLTNPYWSRTWIIQEISLAREVYLIYGGHYIKWETLLRLLPVGERRFTCAVSSAAAWMGLKIQDFLIDADRIAMIATFRHKLKSKQRFSIEHCLLRTTGFAVTNPLDKVYGVLGLTNKAERIPVDYSPEMTLETLYTRVARNQLERDPSLVILRAGIGYKERNGSLALPSWVPDWSQSPQNEVTVVYAAGSKRYNAGGQEDHHIIEDKDAPGQLRIKAISISKVKAVGGLPPTSAYMNISPKPDRVLELVNALGKFIIEAVNLLRDSPAIHPRTKQSRYEATWRTLIGDRVSGWKHSSVVYPAPAKYAASFETTLQFFSLFGGNGSLSLKDMQAPPEKLLQYFLEMHGRPAIGNDGTMMLVPEMTQKGDLLCVLPGVEMPILLRRKKSCEVESDDETVWELVGYCYAHGAMGGEALISGLERRIFKVE